MKPTFGYSLSALADDVKQMANVISIALRTTYDILNNNITFADNMKAMIVYDVALVSGVEKGISHNLGKIPIGFNVIGLSNSAVVFNGTTEWTTNRIYLIASANVTADIIILGG